MLYPYLSRCIDLFTALLLFLPSRYRALAVLKDLHSRVVNSDTWIHAVGAVIHTMRLTLVTNQLPGMPFVFFPRRILE